MLEVQHQELYLEILSSWGIVYPRLKSVKRKRKNPIWLEFVRSAKELKTFRRKKTIKYSNLRLSSLVLVPSLASNSSSSDTVSLDSSSKSWIWTSIPEKQTGRCPTMEDRGWKSLDKTQNTNWSWVSGLEAPPWTGTIHHWTILQFVLSSCGQWAWVSAT